MSIDGPAVQQGSKDTVSDPEITVKPLQTCKFFEDNIKNRHLVNYVRVRNLNQEPLARKQAMFIH